jgi:hypothetical protein
MGMTVSFLSNVEPYQGVICCHVNDSTQKAEAIYIYDG